MPARWRWWHSIVESPHPQTPLPLHRGPSRKRGDRFLSSMFDALPKYVRIQKLIFAKKLRREMTGAEKLLWKALRNRGNTGHKFRRQVPIGPFIVDFLCMDRNVVIEVDGPIHGEQIEYDRRREDFLKKRGFNIIRFTNDEVFGESSYVLQKISEALSPSPVRNRERLERGSGVRFYAPMRRRISRLTKSLGRPNFSLLSCLNASAACSSFP